MGGKARTGVTQSFTVEEIKNFAKGSKGAQPDKLMEQAGISEDDLAALKDATSKLRLVAGYLLFAGRIAMPEAEADGSPTSTLADIAKQMHQQTALMNTQVGELTKSIRYTPKKSDEDAAKFRQDLDQLKKDLRRQPQPAPAESHAVLISGLIKEGSSGRELVATAQDFLTTQVDPARAIHVEEVHRLGRFEENKGDRRVKVVLRSPAEADAVLRAARNLRSYNTQRKEDGQRPVGIDRFLSTEEMAIKKALMGKWKAARDSNLAKVFWRGCKLYVEGKEVQP